MPRFYEKHMKHKIFIREPIRDKSATELPGIGETVGYKLAKAGFEKASTVLGQFLLLKMDKDLFCEWMFITCEANRKQCEDCWECLRKWCNTFL
ncbi:barrier-to-autointegration factor-like [Drosophila suzukii]|uniref:Barrier-to-autointegration factor-like n=1 Tax=Drosophila suzukii TaxID=28584 RepID=A0AB39ZCJ3_DROSZ